MAVSYRKIVIGILLVLISASIVYVQFSNNATWNTASGAVYF